MMVIDSYFERSSSQHSSHVHRYSDLPLNKSNSVFILMVPVWFVHFGDKSDGSFSVRLEGLLLLSSGTYSSTTSGMRKAVATVTAVFRWLSGTNLCRAIMTDNSDILHKVQMTRQRQFLLSGPVCIYCLVMLECEAASERYCSLRECQY